MNATEKYYNRWINDIAKNHSTLAIKRHIIHHANELFGPTRDIPKSWLASMYNLLRIYEKAHHIKTSIPEQLFRLGSRFYQGKKATPPPGGRIPNNVVLSFTPTSKKSRRGEKLAMISALRKIGR